LGTFHSTRQAVWAFYVKNVRLHECGEFNFPLSGSEVPELPSSLPRSPAVRYVLCERTAKLGSASRPRPLRRGLHNGVALVLSIARGERGVEIRGVRREATHSLVFLLSRVILVAVIDLGSDSNSLDK
jgi:hypothetical protein